MNHISDANKMVSDTPRTDDQECDMFVGVSTFTPEDVQQAFNFARTLERELNAANDRIKRLEQAGNEMAQELINQFGKSRLAYQWCKEKEDYK